MVEISPVWILTSNRYCNASVAAHTFQLGCLTSNMGWSYAHPPHWPEPHASLLELEPGEYSWNDNNKIGKPIHYTNGSLIFIGYMDSDNKSIYKYNIKMNSVSKLKDIPLQFNAYYEGNGGYGMAVNEKANELYLFDAKLTIFKSFMNENKWNREYQHYQNYKVVSYSDCYFINDKLHIIYRLDCWGKSCHLIYDAIKHKIITFNELTTDYNLCDVDHILHDEYGKKLIFVNQGKKGRFGEKQLHKNLWFDLSASPIETEWKLYHKIMNLTSDNRGEYDVIIDQYHQILFYFYTTTSYYPGKRKMRIGCFDLLSQRIYESEKILPAKIWFDFQRSQPSSWCNNFQSISNGEIFFFSNRSARGHMKICMKDVIADELKKDRAISLLYGFIKAEYEKKFHHHFPQYLTQIMIKYYA